MIDRLPPHNIDSEEATLGSLLIDGDAILQIVDKLQPLDFYSERNRWIYEASLELYKRGTAINQITVAQELARKDQLENCGGAAFLSHLVSVTPTSLDVKYYADIVICDSANRKLISAATEIEAMGYKNSPDLIETLDQAQNRLDIIRPKDPGKGFTPIRNILDSYLEGPPPEPPGEEIDGEVSGSRTLPNVPSGYPSIDDYLDGMQKTDLLILAGRPSMGKSSLAWNIARNVALEQDRVVGIFSLEMSKQAIVHRMLAAEAQVNSRQIKLNDHTVEEEKRVMDALSILSEAKIYIDDAAQLTVSSIRGRIRRLQREKGIDLVIIDHIGQLTGESVGRWRPDRVQEVSQITRDLKIMVKELNIPALVLSQLSRASENRPNHRPMLSDLRDSGSIEQDADVVMFIYRPAYYFTEEQWAIDQPNEAYPADQAHIIIAKNRNGPTGDVVLRFELATGRFSNMAIEPPAAVQGRLPEGGA